MISLRLECLHGLTQSRHIDAYFSSFPNSIDDRLEHYSSLKDEAMKCIAEIQGS